MYCRMCGERLDDKAQYCAHCGAKVNNDPDKQSESLEEHVTAGRKTNKNKIWVGSITLLVILVVILLIILPRKKNFVSADDSEMKNEYIGVEETEYTGVVRTEEQPELATEMTEASTENQELEKCKQMYMDIVRQQEEEYSGEDYRYGLVYIDDDEIPELVTGIWGYWTSLYTYDSGKIYTLMDKWGYGTGSS